MSTPNRVSYKGAEYVLSSVLVKKTKRCEVCEEDIPLKKWPGHQFSLVGVKAVLCKNMNKAKRRYYERLSSQRLEQAKAKAKALGHTEPEDVERYLQDMGFAEKPRGTDEEILTKRISVPQKW